ncbi:hypothetical protein ACHAWO_004183 [Cyclotella atomus]|uniref:F-box domain-containing protein n=1 Tax=Cyclotella atomus TaxID=382360 RepID=A0ABD3NW88_9STRA
MEVKQMSKREISSPLTRPAKRIKHHPNYNHAHLPPEVWANVMNHLDFASVLSMTAATRNMRDAASLVTHLHITHASQLHASVGRRFKQAIHAFIFSLVQELIEEGEDGDQGCRVDFDTSMRVIPFLSTFCNLKIVYFGGCGEDGTLYQVIPHHRLMNYDDYTEKYLSRLIDTISFGYQCGILSPSLQIKGLYCPKIVDHLDEACEHCWRACTHWPVKSVIEFEHDGSSSSSDKFHSLDVCVGRNELIELLVERPGGVEAVSSSNTLLKILGRCSCTPVGSNGQKILWLVTMSPSVKRDLLGAHQSGLIDVKHPSEVSCAITKSLPSRKKDCYVLSHTAQKCLDDCGLGYRDALFPGRKDLVNEFLPNIVKRHKSLNLLECLHLMEDMITTHTQQIFDSGLVNALVKGIEYDPLYDISVRPEDRPDIGHFSQLLGVLTKLLKCGYDEVKTIVDLGFIDCVKTILSFLSFGERDAINIFDALKSIVKTSPLLRDTVLQSGIVAKFSKCLELNSADVELSCVDMLKAMLCNKNMPPVEHINLHLGLPIGSGLLSLNDFEIVECIGLSLCCQIETKLAEEYRKSRVLPSILKLLTQPSAKVQASAIGLISKYADLNPYTEVKSAFAIKCLEVLSQYLDNESDSVKRKACKSLGCVFDKWSQKPDDTSWESRKISHVALATKRQDIYLKWITSLSALLPTNSPSYVQKLMQYLPDQLQKRIDATDNAHRWLYQIDDAIKTMSYDELSKINLADDYLDDSLSLRVDDE